MAMACTLDINHEASKIGSSYIRPKERINYLFGHFVENSHGKASQIEETKNGTRSLREERRRVK